MKEGRKNKDFAFYVLAKLLAGLYFIKLVARAGSSVGRAVD